MDENAIGWSPTAKFTQTHLFKMHLLSCAKLCTVTMIRTYGGRKKTNWIPSLHLHWTNCLIKNGNAESNCKHNQGEKEIHHRDVHWKVIFISVENFISWQLEMLKKNDHMHVIAIQPHGISQKENEESREREREKKRCSLLSMQSKTKYYTVWWY